VISADRDVHPLSFSQTRIWFLDQLQPHNTAYNVSGAYRLRGPLDVAAFHASFADLVRRHESLRARTVLFDGAPGQVIEAGLPVAGQVQDVPGGLQAALELAELLAAEPFDLTVAPLLRHRLLRLADDDHVFALTVHHIVCDGWSLGVLWRDLEALYAARRDGTTADLPVIPIRFVDYVHRERLRQADEQAVARETDYWRERLDGLAPLRLPTDRELPEDRSPGGGRVPVALSAELVAKVDALSRRSRVTPFMTLLAAFQVLLARWTGQDDIAVGAPVAGRRTADLTDVVGLFANTLVLRTGMAGNPAFRDVLVRVRETVLDAMDHQDLPFDRLVAELQPVRELNRHPYFQVLLALQDVPLAPRLAGIEVERLALRRDSAQFDLSLALFRASEGMYGEIEYATDVFDASTVRCLAEQLVVLLEAVTDGPDQQVTAIPLTRAGSPAPAIPSTVDVSLADLVEAQARRTPHAIALSADGTDFAYADVHERADRLAAVLRARGVAAEVPVGVYGERSPELVVAILAVLKASGACLPLSTALPANRVRAVARAASARLVLICPGVTAPDLDVPVILVPPLNSLAPEPPRTLQPAVAAGPDNLAFVLATSGSSGEPKLVALTHRNLGWFVTTALRDYGLTAGDRLLGFWPHGSDGNVEEIVLTLCGGATLVIVEHVVETAARFARLCRQFDITAIMLPTAYWHHLTDGLCEHGVRLPDTVRLVTFGGERAAPDRLHAWLRQVGNRVRLVNEYGPSETTIFATSHDLSHVDRPRHVPIGSPADEVTAHILDPLLRPVPAGVVGELYLGGLCVVRGYLSSPGETAARFIADPYAPGARLLRTGDLARRGSDGVLEFIGRVDDQVKVRGYRVEPAEVEAALADDPAVAAAAVTADQDGLTGYVVTDAQPESVRARLADRLPGYMVPARIVALDSLPMTATGKVDRRALTAVRHTTPRRTRDPVMPRTPVEHTLAKLWQRTLGIDQVGVLDPFSELGGHSLQAVQIAAGATAAFGVEVSVALILRRPTIAELAKEVETMLPRDENPRPEPRSAGTQAARGVDFRTFVTRPLAALIEAEEIPPVDAASISCIPDRSLAQRGLTAEQYIEDWCQGVPLITGVKQTPVGRIAQVMLPYLEADVYRDPDLLVRTVIPGLRLARRAGARVVSLINLLSSATSHGTTLQEVTGSRDDLPRITTGHAMTTAAVLLNLRQVLAAAGRTMPGEDLAVLGLGSIGHSVLRLLLRQMEHPRRILLCDLYQRQAHLEKIRDELRDTLRFTGPVDVLTATGDSVPDGLYQASTVLAATNVPGVLDVDRLAAGCIVVDDSVPHCFDPARAHARPDVLCVEGGELHSGTPMSELRYVPRWATAGRTWEVIDSWYERDPYRFGGCVLAAALAARFDDVPVTIGVPDPAASEQALELLPQLGFRAVPPQLDDTVLTPAQLALFQQSAQ
jgi:amino acid adenylation domain-containing protein